MTGPEIISLIVSFVAAIAAAGSLWTSRRAQKTSEVQLLPKVDIGYSWTAGGERGVYVNLEELIDRPDWVVSRVTLRRNWYRRRSFLALGVVTDPIEDDLGRLTPTYRRSGDWERTITFDRPVREAAVCLHPDASDCEITVEITLNTGPAPTFKRHIMSYREWRRPSITTTVGVIKWPAS